MRLVIIVTGVYCFLMGYVVQNFGSLLEVSFTMSGVTLGAVLGVFILGILYPWTNYKVKKIKF